MSKPLCERLGGYGAISAVCDDLISRLMNDSQLGRFWAHRGSDGLAREKQLLIDLLCAAAGGPLYYTGRDMKLTHVGMCISDSDWERYKSHLNATIESFNVPATETKELLAFIESTRADIVEIHDLAAA